MPSPNQLIGSWNFKISNDTALLKGLKLVQTGAAETTAVQNLKLFVNGIQVGDTSTLEQNGETDTDRVYFDMSDNPGILHTGSNSINVYGDVVGSPTRDIQLQIFDPYDIFALDSQYGVPIHGQKNGGTDITIQGATLLISRHLTP